MDILTYGALLKKVKENFSATGATNGQVPVANGDGTWGWANQSGGGSGLSMWVGTQTEYTALDTYDSNTIYFIKG